MIDISYCNKGRTVRVCHSIPSPASSGILNDRRTRSDAICYLRKRPSAGRPAGRPTAGIEEKSPLERFIERVAFLSASPIGSLVRWLHVSSRNPISVRETTLGNWAGKRGVLSYVFMPCVPVPRGHVCAPPDLKDHKQASRPACATHQPVDHPTTATPTPTPTSKAQRRKSTLLLLPGLRTLRITSESVALNFEQEAENGRKTFAKPSTPRHAAQSVLPPGTPTPPCRAALR